MRTIFVLAAALIALGCSSARAEAIRIHPENPRYFLFRGKPVVLLTASEHYGSVMNRPFDFEKYLDDAAAHKMTLTRTFLLFRELQGARNPSSPCKPDSPDYIAPFPRTGPGKALDGELIYDLDQWNPEYFDRLHRFLDAASQRGIIVELTLFSNTYADPIWALNPFRSENNKQHMTKMEWPEYLSLKDPELVRRQSAYARKIIDETSAYGNIYYEICNEPGGGVKGHIPPADVDAWQTEMGRVVREELQRVNRPHLIAGQQAFTYSPKFRFPLDETYSRPLFDIVNVHPLPDTDFSGKLYQLGNFMSKELMLSEIARFCRDVFSQKKPTVLDEDNTASMYRDPVGWTIHRKRAWTALLNGAQYDYIDFSITVGSEAGTPLSRKDIRSWMQHLSEFMSSFDYIHSLLAPDWVGHLPAHVISSGLSAAGRDYVGYLADSREVTDPTAGQPLSGTVTLTLPRGKFVVTLYSPVTGQYSPAILVQGGAATLDLPPFAEDIVIRARKNAQ
ncbi:MAG: DUF6298 domain-containing protein [Acidobacteriota bacterium]|nr:DUF6298 domain-containing protein [Acidobacteriota bacterium]